MKRLLQCWILFLGILMFPLATHACTVCVELPERTLADRLLQDRIVVLTRPSSDNPFRYDVIETIAGDARNLTELPEIPFLVDAATRRRFQSDDTLTVAMSFGTTDDGLLKARGWGAWHRLMVLTPERRQFVDEILARRDSWSRNGRRNPDRFAFFAAHHTHPDRAIQIAALAEIERAPYAFLRSLRETLPPAELRRRLLDVNEIPFESLYVLLLGLSDLPQADAYVSQRFDQAMGHKRISSADWIVAGIEVGGRNALKRVSQKLLDKGALAQDERRELVSALSVTGTARPALRAEISPVLQDVAKRHPERLADIAYTLYLWEDWTLVPFFEQLLEDRQRLDQATRSILQLHVTSAHSKAG